MAAVCLAANATAEADNTKSAYTPAGGAIGGRVAGLCSGRTALDSTTAVSGGTSTTAAACWSVEAAVFGRGIDAARSTSAATMRPWGPDPDRPEDASPAAMRAIDVPDSFASFLAKGEEKSLLPAAAAATAAVELGIGEIGVLWEDDTAEGEVDSAAGAGTGAALALTLAAVAAVVVVW